jgi:hypothetical protein
MDELCLGHGLWLVNANEIVYVSVGVGEAMVGCCWFNVLSKLYVLL